MRNLISPAILFAAMLSCSGSGDDAADRRQRCADARDHVVDIRIARLGSEVAANPLANEIPKHRATMTRALGEAYIDRCVALGDDYTDCLQRAGDDAALAACEKENRR